MITQPLALLFDIDGTLIDSAGAGGRALQKALADQFQIAETRPVTLHGRTDLGIMSELLESHGLAATPESLEELSSHYFRLLPEELSRQGGRVLPGVLELLEGVGSMESCFCGVLTGNMPISARAKLDHFQLGDYFDFGIYGDRVHHRPELCEVALAAVRERCGEAVSPQRMVIIGDTPLDVALAQAMGSRCLAVCTGGVDAASLATAGADWVVEDLRDTDRILSWLRNPLHERLSTKTLFEKPTQ